MTKRVAVIEFINETNTFTILRTTMNDFHMGHYLKGNEVPKGLEGTNTEVGGFMQVAEQCCWEAVYTIAAHAEPGGIVTETAREEITNEALSRLKSAGEYDGVFIAMHGAMVTQTSQDGETQFLEQVRAVVGEHVPIAVTLDLHANIFDAMINYVDIVVTYRTYPHVDMRERGIEACQLLDSAMKGKIQPKLAIVRPAMLVGCDDGRTTDNGPMCKLLESAAQEMTAPGIINVAINAGFISSDVYAAGPSVIVTYDALNSDEASATATAQRICDQIWEYRDCWALPIPLLRCIEELEQHVPTGKPVVVADFSDNPGAGGYSDCTRVLAALRNSGLKNIAVGALYDPQAVAELIKTGIGKQTTLWIGGKSDPNSGGQPMELNGTVVALSDGLFVFEGPMFTALQGTTGASVCFRTGEIDIMIVSERMQMFDKNIFRTVGIEPEKKDIVVVKSMQHFRAAFAPIAEKVIVTDAGGLCSPDVTSREYKNVRRPVFPLQD